MIRRWGLLCLSLAACSCAQSDPDNPSDALPVPTGTTATTIDSNAQDSTFLRPLEIPVADSGRVAIVSRTRLNQDYRVDTIFTAQAWGCSAREVEILYAKADDGSVGFIALLAKADSSSQQTSYPIAHAERGPVSPGTARAGLQIIARGADYALHAVSGVIEVESFSPDTITAIVSGRFVDPAAQDTIRVAARFGRVASVPGDSVQCAVIPSAARRDSER